MTDRCACGRPLHYSYPGSERVMREIVAMQGETVVITVTGGESYRVPRHYIALHGLAAADLRGLAARYNWKRV